jgi:ATP-dependent helicase/nuclease subunit A
MSGFARDRANAEQRAASDPAVSAFVAASAGSGKTKLLTDRLLRLMLGGADPGRIQCLTFTKAAAAEMAVRLQKTLGAWVTLDDAALDAQLRERDVEPDAATRAAARALFARVLDLPGGMRIGTIHAFCQSLLRRFPLEAALSPHFRLVDEIDADLALRDARETMLAEAHTPERAAALDALAGMLKADAFGKLVAALQSDRERLARALSLGPDGLEAAQRRVLGAAGDELALLTAAVACDEPPFRRLCEVLHRHGGTTSRATAARLLEWLSIPVEERAGHWEVWCKEFLRADGEPKSFRNVLVKAVLDVHPDAPGLLEAEQARVVAVQDGLRALQAAAASAALVRLAAPVAAEYARRKDVAALLDYDDLVVRTTRLLEDPGAAWVLYKLDGGLDHLLLDEVQDTAPAQWEIAGRLTEEFFAGDSARDVHRTVFAVGDRKQSIYSFQGADPDAFEHWRGVLRRRVGNAGELWRDVALDVSFRSTKAVLDLVDAAFAGPLAAEGVTEPGALHHVPDRAGQAGQVELWPLAPRPEAPEVTPWSVPERNLGLTSAPQLLADRLAEWIAGSLGTLVLESRGRTLLPGDVLVLVRRRNAFAGALVRALKARGVAVAGLDRMVLTDQPAVADLLALCDALLLPQDDLALACVLTSPLGGLSDDSLMALAMGRPGSLWDALRDRAGECQEWRTAREMLTSLLARVDFAAPYALLAEALGPLGGRARLLARLGPEAAEPVDELLNAALRWQSANPPSLQAFVHWLRRSGAEVKREAEATQGAGLVRIMTVHGAKGLQAPLVILPDTTSLPPDDTRLAWVPDPDAGVAVPIWAPRKELRCVGSEGPRLAAAARRAEEHNRLLYVALTRAEDRLVVCGWQPKGEPPPTSWYALVRDGFLRIGAEAVPFAGPWEGEMLRHACRQEVAVVQAAAPMAAPSADLPGWAGRAPLWRADSLPAEPALPERLAPSRPEDASLGPVPQAASPLLAREGTRFRRGQQAHLLLQHLPQLAPELRLAAARTWLTRPGLGLAGEEAEELAREVLAVLDHPALAPLFGPHGRAEVPLTGVVGGRVVGGLVDRLAVLEDRVLLADWKTNREAPARAEDVPVLYLRQMAAYRSVLRGAFPGRAVVCTLVWTAALRVMPLCDSLLDRHAPHAERVPA